MRALVLVLVLFVPTELSPTLEIDESGDGTHLLDKPDGPKGLCPTPSCALEAYLAPSLSGVLAALIAVISDCPGGGAGLPARKPCVLRRLDILPVGPSDSLSSPAFRTLSSVVPKSIGMGGGLTFSDSTFRRQDGQVQCSLNQVLMHAIPKM